MPAKSESGFFRGLPDLSLEQALWKQGLSTIGGVDEAGRGAWAGPVSAGVVILANDPDIQTTLHGVRDSKQMTPAQRGFWAEKIKSSCMAWAVGFSSSEEIDSLGILPATRLAVQRATGSLSLNPDHLITDYLFIPDVEIPQTSLVKGDQRSLSIAAASILAKTTRDALMLDLHNQFPFYQFSRHKGYGTAIHQAALFQHGLCPIHRRSFHIHKYLESKNPL